MKPEPSFGGAFTIFGLALSAIVLGLRLGAGMHLPLFLALAVVCAGAASLGMSWQRIQAAMFQGVADGLPAASILLLIGMIVGLWGAGGTIPTLIYYGLTWLSSTYLIPAACMICTVASLVTGTSFGTVSTVGLALMGVGEAMGVPAPMLAGAIVSGAYFGDKMSPLSDTTNVAPAVSGSNIYEHIVSMMYTTLPALILTLGGLFVVGKGASSQTASPQAILVLRESLAASFRLGPLTLIPAFAVLVMAVRRVPPVPALSLGIGISMTMALFTQKVSISTLAKSMASGYAAATGNQLIDKLLSRGGMNAMLPTILLILMATGMGGVLRESGVVAVLVRRLLQMVKSPGSLILSVISSCFLVLLASGNQMLAIILPGQAFKEAFLSRGIRPSVLSRTLEDAGTLGAPLVPWSTAALFIQGMLKVPAVQYAPYAFLNWIAPTIAVFYAITATFIFERRNQD